VSASQLLPPTNRRLTRSRQHKIIAGVCGGVAEYLEVDPTVVRVVYVIASVASAAFPGVLAYIILAFLMPLPDSPPK
jgi:phage shock protein C